MKKLLAALVALVWLKASVLTLAEVVREAEHDVVNLAVELKAGSLTFTVTNMASEPITINRGYSHHQNMYLVALRENGFFGDVMSSNSVVGGDPPFGIYELPPGGTVTEDVNLLHLYPELAVVQGKVLVFWSTDLSVEHKGILGEMRLGGSRRIHAPISLEE